MSQAGILYIVATPIGHLQDISYRAVDVLSRVDKIAAEDTRHSRILLDHYGITTPMLSLHQHNEANRAAQVITWLQQGLSVALISDAGTPLISDPGYVVVAAVKAAGLAVVPVPGACAFVTALSASGLPTDQCRFIGFLPSKGAVRTRMLQALQSDCATLIFYESPRRLIDLLERMLAVFGPARRVVLARELTKQFETIESKTLSAMLEWVCQDPMQQRGECVVMIEGAPERDQEQAALMTAQDMLPILMAELSLKKAVEIAVRLTGCRKKALYQYALSQKISG